MALLPADFESAASTSSAIPAEMPGGPVSDSSRIAPAAIIAERAGAYNA
jgi:hypothetical protein